MYNVTRQIGAVYDRIFSCKKHRTEAPILRVVFFVRRDMRDKRYNEKLNVVPSRLRQVLEETFCGNVLLMAYCCGVDKITLKAWLDGKRLPQSLGTMPYVIGVNYRWLEGDSDSRAETDPSISHRLNKQYSEMYALTDREQWLKRELIRVNALREKENERIRQNARIRKEANAERNNDVMSNLAEAADRLGYGDKIVKRTYNMIKRYEAGNGKLTDTPRELWKAIRGCGKKTLALLYEAFPEK